MSSPLAGRYQALLFDCDGVLYLGEDVVPAAPAAVARIRATGCAVAFVTNNSSVAPAAVAARLARLGVPADAGEVTTSAQAAVAMLGGPEKLTGVQVLVVGGDGLRAELAAAGAVVLDPADDWRAASTVVVGFTRTLTYDQLRRATLAIGAGARFVGTNPDLTLPTPDGPWPGAGATLALLAAATGRQPEVAGKPEAPMLTTAAAAAGPGPYLMVGDRADTDLDGAARLGWDTALVLTGVTGPAQLLNLAHPPTFVLRDVGGLTAPVPPVIRAPDPAERPAARELLTAGPLGGAPTAAADPAGSLVAVTDDGQLTGAVAWTRRGAATAVVHGPAVISAARGQLTGTRLLLAAAAALRAQGVRRLVAPGAASGFLTRFGFHPADHAPPADRAAAEPEREGPEGEELVRELPVVEREPRGRRGSGPSG